MAPGGGGGGFGDTLSPDSRRVGTSSLRPQSVNLALRWRSYAVRKLLKGCLSGVNGHGWGGVKWVKCAISDGTAENVAPEELETSATHL